MCAFGALIKEPLLSSHPILNVHPSLLPRWRGAAPIERAILAGDAETGVSIMRLTAGLDSGPVCLQERVPIAPDDDYGTLAARLEAARRRAARAARSTSSPHCVEQDEAGVTYAEKLTAEDRRLDPTEPAAAQARRVRALSPHIGAYLEQPDGSRLGVWKAAVDGDQLELLIGAAARQAPDAVGRLRSGDAAGERGAGPPRRLHGHPPRVRAGRVRRPRAAHGGGGARRRATARWR